MMKSPSKEEMKLGDLGHIEIGKLKPWKENPKGRDAKGIPELAASVRRLGILNPLLVRHQSGGVYSVIAGNRRLEAAKMAELKSVPCFVLSGGEDLEISLTENTQRENLDALTEAAMMASLAKETGKAPEAIVDELAARLGRPTAYIYRRLRLLRLFAGPREALASGKIGVSQAEVISRLEDEAAQKAVLKAALEGRSAKDLALAVQEHMMKKLSDAPWKLDDKTLVKKAGACATCPKRTQAQALMFSEAPKEDRCLDGGCWSQKEEAYAKVMVEIAKGAGASMATASEVSRHTRMAWRDGGQEFEINSYGDYRDLALPPRAHVKSASLRTILGDAKVPTKIFQKGKKVLLGVHVKDIIKALGKEKAEKALGESAVEPGSSGSGSYQPSKAQKEAMRKAKALNRAAPKALALVAERAEKAKGVETLLALLTPGACQYMGLQKVIARRNPAMKDFRRGAEIIGKGLTGKKALAFALECLAGEWVGGGSWGRPMEIVAKAFKINLGALVAAELKAMDKKAHKKGGKEKKNGKS